MFLLIFASLLFFAINVSEAETKDALVVSEETIDAKVASLFAKFYDDGVYTKNTNIYVDTTKPAVVKEMASYFHASIPTTERTTYYSSDALWMSRGNGEYSYYGTAYEGETAVGVTNATAITPYETPVNASVVLKGENKNSMEEYYVTLKDFKDNPGTDWGIAGNYYVSTDATIIDNFRLFTAPLWLNSESSKNYISFYFATLEIIDSNLVMKLWTSSTDSEKLTTTDTEVVSGVTYYVFSKATILHKHAHTILNSDNEAHWYECECGEKSNVVAHTGGTATTTEQAVCEICNKSYGDLVEISTKTYYFVPGVWAENDATFGIKVLNSTSEETFMPVSLGESGFYEITCSIEMTHICIYRFDSTSTIWWNGVEYLEIPANKDMFVITSWESYLWDEYLTVDTAAEFVEGDTLYLQLNGDWSSAMSGSGFAAQFEGLSGSSDIIALELVDSTNGIYKITVPVSGYIRVRFAQVNPSNVNEIWNVSDYTYCDHDASTNLIKLQSGWNTMKGNWSKYSE